MRDRRTVDDLSVEELEHILIRRKREARLARLQSYGQSGRTLPKQSVSADDGVSAPSRTEPGAMDSLRDRLLIGVEVAAAAGLIAVLALAVTLLSDINTEAAAAQAEQLAAQPTAEPTPLLSAVVLPGGHTPPTAPGGARPNYEEVPANLRPAVEQQFAGPVVIPTSAPQVAIRLQIPAIEVDAPVVQGDGWEQLKRGVAQHIPSAHPGERGNTVLSGHNDIYGEVFRYLDRLQEGDEIMLYTQTRTYTYRIAYTRIVEPTDVSVMAPSLEPIVTLISCYPYLVNSDRIIVVGELVG